MDYVDLVIAGRRGMNGKRCRSACLQTQTNLQSTPVVMQRNGLDRKVNGSKLISLEKEKRILAHQISNIEF
jgi:hypothetical protein